MRKLWTIAAAAALFAAPAARADDASKTQEAKQDANQEVREARKDAAEKKADAQKEVREAQADASKEAREAEKDVRETQADASKDVNEARRDAAEERRADAGDRMGDRSDRKHAFDGKDNFDVDGKVQEVSANSITIAREELPAVTLDIQGWTEIQLDGEKSSRAALQPGQEVKASFNLQGDKPVAVEIEAKKAE